MGKGSKRRDNFKNFANSPYWEKRESSLIIQRWRQVLDACDPVIDEENAAKFLNDVQTYFEKRSDKYEIIPRHAAIIIPMFRRILNIAKMHYEPNLIMEKPILSCSWSKDLTHDLTVMYGVDLENETINIMEQDLENCFQDIGSELTVNFELNDHEVKFYAEPYKEG